MNKRKLLLVASCLLMVAILGFGGTLAYLTDDEKILNTFTLGDIEINIEEKCLDKDGKVVPYVDKVKLNPIENEQGIARFNKMVRTFNVSSSKNEAYIRTIVLIEANDLLDSTYVNEGECAFPGIHVSHDTESGMGSDGLYYHAAKEYAHLAEKVTVDGEEYWAIAYVTAGEEPVKYNEALSSLANVWVDKNITSDQIKGWNGEISVLVYSQAVQAESLTHAEAMDALGDFTKANVEAWLKGDVETGIVNDWPN